MRLNLLSVLKVVSTLSFEPSPVWIQIKSSRLLDWPEAPFYLEIPGFPTHCLTIHTVSTLATERERRWLAVYTEQLANYIETYKEPSAATFQTPSYGLSRMTITELEHGVFNPEYREIELLGLRVLYAIILSRKPAHISGDFYDLMIHIASLVTWSPISPPVTPMSINDRPRNSRFRVSGKDYQVRYAIKSPYRVGDGWDWRYGSSLVGNAISDLQRYKALGGTAQFDMRYNTLAFELSWDYTVTVSESVDLAIASLQFYMEQMDMYGIDNAEFSFYKTGSSKYGRGAFWFRLPPDGMAQAEGNATEITSF